MTVNWVLCDNGNCACCRLSLQIEPPKGAEGGTAEGGAITIDGGRTMSGTQLCIRAESAPCVKAHSFCGGSSSLRPLHRKTKTATIE